MKFDQQIKAFIFDMDGVLFSTQKANDEAYQFALEEQRIVVPSNFYQHLYGNKFEKIIREYYPEMTDEIITKIKKLKHLHYSKKLNEIQQNKELFSIIHFFKGQLPIGLATSAAKENALMILRHFQVENLFDSIIYFEDVKEPKPSPECFLLCAKRLGVEIQNCLVWEDSPEGIQAAQAAGAKFIQVSF